MKTRSMREDEEHAKEIFLRFLAAAEPGRPVSCQPGDNPPDYLFTLDGEKFAVEVTNIPRLVGLGKSFTLSASAVYNSLFSFLDELENRSKATGILRGAYGVSARQTENFAAKREGLAARILNFVRETQGIEQTESVYLKVSDRCRWRLRKYGLHADCIYPMVSLSTGYGEMMRQLEVLVPASLDRKVCLLSRIQEPTILLLIDGLHLPKHDDWLEVVTEKAAESIHSVVRISRLHDGWQVLRSRFPSWLRDEVRTRLPLR